MRVAIIGLLSIGVMLGGCHHAVGMGGDDGHRGRYSGIGLYSADHAWARIDGAPKPGDNAQATTADDTTIIVTIDGATGEIRQCGNYSGHCVGLNPWRGELGAKQGAPVSLTARDEAMDTNVADAAPETNDAAPAKK